MDLDEALAAKVLEAQRKTFAEGWKDGAKTTLQLLLGESVLLAKPYRGHLNQSAREWAEEALKRLEEG